MKKLIIGLVLVGGAAWGHQHPDAVRQWMLKDFDKQFNTTYALSKLREYQVGQNLYRQETDGRFAARLLDLYRQDGHAEYVSADLAQASAQQPRPIPFHGYLFADLTSDSNGHRVNPAVQFGLAAYPARPGVSGDVLILILQNETIPRPEDHGTHTIWARPFKSGDSPPTRWPSAQELSRQYERLDRSIEAGTRQSRALFERSRQAAAGIRPQGGIP